MLYSAYLRHLLDQQPLRRTLYRLCVWVSLEMHPDKRRQRGIPVTQEDRERFIRAKEAYEVLSDPKRRKVYDALGELGVQLTENPTSVDQNKVMRTMSHMSETTRCSILLIALAFVGFFRKIISPPNLLDEGGL